MPHAANPRPSLYGLTPHELGAILGGSGRARAVWAVARTGGDPFASGASVALGPRATERLGAACDPNPARVVSRAIAPCGTTKLLLALVAGGAVETVLIPHRGRTTVCVSSQIGCARACIFCVTATMGLVRSLGADEIVGQVKAAVDEARERALPPIRNLVFMGMGEPLDNLAATRQAIAIATDPLAFALAPGNVTLSTVGTDPVAIRAAGALPVRLAWSLHAADDELRRRLIPTTRYPLHELRDAFAAAIAARNAILFVEVTLIDGVNDGAGDAQTMARFLAPLAGRVRVNLLPMNPGRPNLAAAAAARTIAFREALRAHGYFCLVRRARGIEASAACGQLATAATTARDASSPEGSPGLDGRFNAALLPA